MAAALLRRGTGLCFKCIHREVCRLVWKPQAALFSSKPSDPRKQPRRTHIKKAKPKPAVDVAKLLEQLFSQRRHDTLPPAGRASTRPATLKTTLSMSPPSSKTKPAVSISPKTSPLLRTSPLSPPMINVSAKSASSPLPKSTVGISTKISPSSKLTSPLPFIVSDMTTQVALMGPPPAETIEATVETSTGSGELTAAPLPLTVETLASTVTVEPLVETVTAPISDPACNAFPVEDTIEPTVDARPSPLETLETRAASVEGTVEPRVEPAVDTATQAIETNTTDPGADILSQTALIETNTIESTAMSVKSKAETTVESNILSSGTVVGRREAKEEVEEVEERAGEEEACTVPEAMTLESVTLAEVKALVESLPIDALLETKATLDDKAERLARDAPVQTGSGAEHDAATETQNLSEILLERDSLSEDVEALEAETDILMEELLCSVPEAVSKKPSSALHGAPLGERRDTMWREVEVEEEVMNVVGAMNLESITPAEVEAAVGTLETDVLKETTPEKEILVEEERMEEKAGALPGETTESDASAPDSLSEAADALEAETPVVLEAMFCSTPGPMLQEPTLQNKASGDREAECGRTEKPTGQDSVRESAIHGEERAEEGGSVLEALESVALAEVEAEAGTLESLHAETDMMEELLFSAPGQAAVVTEAPIGREVAREGFLDGKEIEVKEALTLESITMSEVEALVDVVTETKTLLETEAEVEAEAGTLESLSPPEALQAETDVMEELLFSAPGRASVVTEVPIGQEVVREGFLEGKVAKATPAGGGEKGGEEIEVKEALMLESITMSEVEALVDVLTETKTQLETEAETSDAVLQNALCSVAVGSASTDSATTTSHPAAPSALEEVTGQEEQETGSPPAAPAGRRQEVETEEAAEETEALGTDEGLDPVQRLFLEKIREYNNNRRLCGGAVEEGPDYEKLLSEEKAKLQRLYGGGDLSSFPEFTFTEPKLDQDFT